MSMMPPPQPPDGVPPYTPPPYASQGYPPQGLSGVPAIEYANVGLRLVAIIVDGLIVGVPLLIIEAIIGVYATLVGTLISIVAFLLYEGLLLAMQNGQTIGKRLMNIRVVSTDGQPLTMNKTFTRAGVKAILSLVSSIKPPVTSILVVHPVNSFHIAGTLFALLD